MNEKNDQGNGLIKKTDDLARRFVGGDAGNGMCRGEVWADRKKSQICFRW
jgi:hypothetical protein